MTSRGSYRPSLDAQSQLPRPSHTPLPERLPHRVYGTGSLINHIMACWQWQLGDGWSLGVGVTFVTECHCRLGYCAGERSYRRPGGVLGTAGARRRSWDHYLNAQS